MWCVVVVVVVVVHGLGGVGFRRKGRCVCVMLQLSEYAAAFMAPNKKKNNSLLLQLEREIAVLNISYKLLGGLSIEGSKGPSF